MLTRSKLIMTTAIAALAGTVATQASGAPGSDDDGRRGPKLAVLERPAERLERSIDVHEKRLERQERREQAAKQTNEATSFDSPESYGVSQSTLDAIASCESGGDPTAVSSDGQYRGKYQFTRATWARMGGSGDPAAAPEAEQDMRAAMLYAQAGSSPWPICGA